MIIFGANGRVGRKLVEYAFKAGYKVTAFVRNSAQFPLGHLTDRVIEGDVLDAQAVMSAMAGHQVVMSSIGTRQLDEPVTTMSTAMQHIVAAMKAHGVWRIVGVAGAGILQDSRDQLRMDNSSFPQMFRHVSEDHLREWKILEASGLKWTLACPPYVPDGPRTGQYATKGDYQPHAVSSIFSADLADWMVREVMEEHYLRARVGISNVIASHESQTNA